MSKVVEEAPNEDGVPVTLQVLLSDSSLILEHDKWFRLLQDDGKEMTPNEILISGTKEGETKEKIQDDSSRWIFLSRT
jgi:hypothetical protein